MDLGIASLKMKNLLESNPLKSRFLVRELTAKTDRARIPFGDHLLRYAHFAY